LGGSTALIDPLFPNNPPSDVGLLPPKGAEVVVPGKAPDTTLAPKNPPVLGALKLGFV